MTTIPFDYAMALPEHRYRDLIAIDVSNDPISTDAVREKAADPVVHDPIDLIIDYGGAPVICSQISARSVLRVRLQHEGGHQDPQAYRCTVWGANSSPAPTLVVRIAVQPRERTLFEQLADQAVSATLFSSEPLPSVTELSPLTRLL